MREAVDAGGSADERAGPSAAPLDVSVIIVAWNSGAVLHRCLRALGGRAAEIIVVDNASADGTTGTLAAEFPGVRLVALAANIGFGPAVNRGARLARGDALFLLNPDTEPAPDAVEALARHLAASPRCGAAGARLVGMDGETQRGFNVRRFPTLASWAVDLLLIDHVWPGNPITRRYLALDLDPDAPASVDQPAAAALMVRRRAFEAIGGMDEAFVPAWFEDVDLCRRLCDAGWDVAYVPSAVVRHEGGRAMRALGPRFAPIWYANLLRYARKHEPLATVAALRALLAIGMIVRMGVAAVRLDGAALASYGRALRIGVLGR